MGGSGSGKWYRRIKKAVVEDSLRIDVRAWQRLQLLGSTGYFSWCWSNSHGEKQASIGVRSELTQIVLTYRVQQSNTGWQNVEERVQIVYTACNYGGTRPWFICPNRACGRRTAILFISEPYFRCRRCCKLSYASQRESRADPSLRRVQNIRMRLGGGPSLMDRFPEKPKKMRWSTYAELREEANRAEMEYLAPMQKLLG
jgi:hypothetical protein